MRKIIIAFLLVTSLVVPASASAMTAAEEQAKIAQLLVIIAELQARINAILNGGLCLNLTSDLYPNSTDSTTGGQVSRLQTFLVKKGLLVIPEGVSKGHYGIATQGAVQKFQSQYGIVYHGTPATTGYGKVGPSTRAKINSVSCASTPTTGVPVSGAGSSGVTTANPSVTGGGSSSSGGGGSSGGGSSLANSKQCNDNIDNDNDDVIDYPYEPGCTSATDNSEGNEPLIIVQQDLSSSVWNMNNDDNLGGEKSYIFGADPDGDGYINTEWMDVHINGSSYYGTPGIPQSFKGYVVIDLEAGYLDALREPTSSANFQRAQNEMIEALEYGKSRRPNAKWGYYALPNFPYWIGGAVGWDDATQAQKDAEDAIVLRPTALLNAVDFYAPSIYPSYPNAVTPQYVHENDLAFSIHATEASIAHANGKPVFPFISHRFYNGDDENSYKLVPWDEFQAEQLETVIDAGGDGVVWWGADTYWDWLAYATLAQFQQACQGENAPSVQQCLQNYLNLQTVIASAFNAEIPPGMNHTAYFNALHEQYLRLIAESVRDISYTPHVITAPAAAPILTPQSEDPLRDIKGSIQQFFANLSQSFAATYIALINLFSGGN